MFKVPGKGGGALARKRIQMRWLGVKTKLLNPAPRYLPVADNNLQQHPLTGQRIAYG